MRDEVCGGLKKNSNLRPGSDAATSDLLLSIVMHSNRPKEFASFLDNLQQTAENPKSFEVVVKIDNHDEAMNREIAIEQAARPFALKFISTPLAGGFYELWQSMNELLRICDPRAYFVVNLNDEIRVRTPAWDRVLRRYVGLFPDHIFRLRTSANRFRNYYDFWEAGFANDTSAIMTRKWIEIGGDWCPCNGPDSFQECVAFYFGRNRWFWNNRDYRDLAISDVTFEFSGPGLGIERAALRERMRGAFKAWLRLMSHEMQEEASRRAEKLYAHVWAYRNGITDFTVFDERHRRSILVTENYHPWRKGRFYYGLSYFRVTSTNLYRICRFGTFFYGDGYWLKRSWHQGIGALLCLLSENIDRLADLTRAEPYYANDVRHPTLRRLYRLARSMPRRLLAAAVHPRLAARSLKRRCACLMQKAGASVWR